MLSAWFLLFSFSLFRLVAIVFIRLLHPTSFLFAVDVLMRFLSRTHVELLSEGPGRPARTWLVISEGPWCLTRFRYSILNILRRLFAR